MLDPQLVDQTILYPSFCVDGSQPTPHEPAVETHIEIVGGYHIYLSKRLVVASGRLYGMIEKHDGDELLGQIDALMLQVVERDAQIIERDLRLAELETVERAIAGAAARFGDLEADDEPVRKKAA